MKLHNAIQRRDKGEIEKKRQRIEWKKGKRWQKDERNTYERKMRLKKRAEKARFVSKNNLINKEFNAPKNLYCLRIELIKFIMEHVKEYSKDENKQK